MPYLGHDQRTPNKNPPQANPKPNGTWVDDHGDLYTWNGN